MHSYQADHAAFPVLLTHPVPLYLWYFLNPTCLYLRKTLTISVWSCARTIKSWWDLCHWHCWKETLKVEINTRNKSNLNLIRNQNYCSSWKLFIGLNQKEKQGLFIFTHYLCAKFPSAGAPCSFSSWNTHGDCTKPWDLLQGNPPPFGLFIFSSKLLLLSYVFSMENIDKQVLPSAKTLHRKMGMPYKMRKLKSKCWSKQHKAAQIRLSASPKAIIIQATQTK